MRIQPNNSPKVITTIIISAFLTSCTEIINFVGASLDLANAFFKWLIILIVGGFILAFIIGIIRQIFGMNKDKE